jgi:hypothetical protein
MTAARTGSFAGSRSRWLLLAPILAAAGCTGIFQRSQPARPATYAVRAEGPVLRVGSAEREVTPEVGGYMGGFSIGRTSEGVASPLKVRALVMEIGDRRFAIVGVDNLGVMREDSDWIKSGIAGFANGDVFLCSSHTHAGPDLIGLWGWYFLTSGRSHDYLRQMRIATAEAVAEARKNAAPATLVRGDSRLMPETSVRNSNFGACFDRRFDVVHARAVDDGRPLGTLLHMACHPEVLSRRLALLSSDFVGALCDGWRERGHGQAVFVNGALGAMVTPRMKNRDESGARDMGAELLGIAEQALAGAALMPVDSIEVRRRDVFIPLDTFGLRLGRLTMAIPREMHEGCARTTVGWLRIGSLQAVAVPGEAEPAFAQRIRDRVGVPDLLLFGLCDDELGYLLREQDARDREFAYERSMSACVRAGEMVEEALVGPRAR